MKLGAIPENESERDQLEAGLVPTPMLDTLPALGLARMIMVATKLGVFEALAGEPLTKREVAVCCGTDPRATGKLMNTLVGANYLCLDEDLYTLAPVARKWLLKDSPQSLRDYILFRFIEWEYIERFEDFVRSGKPISQHEELTNEQWDLYQRAMRSLASLSAAEIAERTPVPKGARDMLDIGGSHGYYSVSICHSHPGLRATVLDLPQAVAHAAPLLAKEGMGDRVVHRAGDALTDDLGTEAYDLVFVAGLFQHFNAGTSRSLVRRIEQSLRPGGYFVILEAIRSESPQEIGGQLGSFMESFFALLSETGTWSFEELARWQKEAGLEPQEPLLLKSAPSAGLQVAWKPYI